MDIDFTPISTDDLDIFEKIFCEEKMMEHLGGKLSKEACKQKFEVMLEKSLSTKTQHYKIIEKNRNQAVGTVGWWLKNIEGEEIIEVGFMVIPPFWGKGIATLACKYICSDAQTEFPKKNITAFPNRENTGSKRTLEKCGFKLLREVEFPYNDITFTAIYYILNERADSKPRNHEAK